MPEQCESLTTEAAFAIIDAIDAIAVADGRAVAVAVADAAGAMLAVRRPHGIGRPTADVAMAMAYTAGTTGRSTRALRVWKSDNVIAFDQLSALTGKTMLVVDGGFPILVSGRSIGAVGVSGSPSEVDHRVAEDALI